MKRYVPMRNADNPHHVELMPVSEEVYAEITRETSRIRNKKQYHGQCACPRKYLWKCDGDCSLCEYSAAGDNLSLDYENDLHGEHFSDGCDIEEMVTDQLMMRLILERLAELLPVALTIGKMKLDEELSERQCLEQLDLKRSTYRSQLERARKQLEKEFGIKI